MQYLEQGASCLDMISGLHIEHGKQKLCLDKIRLFLGNIPKLYNGEILSVMLRYVECLIKALDKIRILLYYNSLTLYLIQKMIRPVVDRIRIKVIADDPLYQSIRRLSHLVEDKSEQITRIRTGLVIMKRFLKIDGSTAQIVELRPLKPDIIIRICNFSKARLNLHSHNHRRHCRVQSQEAPHSSSPLPEKPHFSQAASSDRSYP